MQWVNHLYNLGRELYNYTNIRIYDKPRSHDSISTHPFEDTDTQKRCQFKSQIHALKMPWSDLYNLVFNDVGG